MNQYQWKTKEGETINIKDLEDSHLINIINLMKKTAEKVRIAELDAAYSCGEPSGEMASMCFESGINQLHESTTIEILENFVPKSRYILNEARKRGIKIED